MSELKNNLKKYNKVLVVHHMDLDGIASAAVAVKAICDTGSLADIQFMGYNYEDTNKQADIIKRAISERRLIIIVDVSICDSNIKSTFEPLTNENSKIECIWIDHHQSSVDTINTMLFPSRGICSDGVVCTSRCGAYLAYQYFFPDKPIPMVIELVDDHDRWVHSFDPGYLNTVFEMDSNLRNPSSGIWYKLLSSETLDALPLLCDLISRGKSAYEIRQHVNEEYYKRTGKIVVFEFRVDGNVKNSISVNTMNGVGNSSLFGDDIYGIAKTAMRYNIGWADTEPIASVTFYSTEDGIRCNELAAVFGGGGHPHAAGCRMPLKDFILNKADSVAYISYSCNSLGLMGVPKITIDVSESQYNRIFG